MSRHRSDSSVQAGPSQRQLRVAELVRHAVAEILARGEIADPVISGHLITVPEVRMSPDLRLATIYVVTLGGKDESAVLKALEAHHKFIRTEIAHRVNLRYAPDIRFRRDDRFEEAERIDRLLRSPEVARDLDPAGPSDETDDPDDEEIKS
ncbi:MAG: 30S ribosome-binding factor RbfA [Bacteroidales bacterium]|nr:30S ribosome-binding factor RbfA [Bacteroidales bacterium]